MGEGRGAISRCRVVVGTAATVKAQKQSCERVCVCVCVCVCMYTRADTIVYACSCASASVLHVRVPPTHAA